MASVAGTHLSRIAVMTDMPAKADARDTPTMVFPYIAGWLETLSKNGAMSYIVFGQDEIKRRRDTTTNQTMCMIDIPDAVLSPDWGYRPVSSKAHLDASVKKAL